MITPEHYNEKSIMDEITNSVHNDLRKQIDNVIIEGLKKHGHEFKSTHEMIHFIKTRCRAVSFSTGVTIYYADEKPYLEMTERFEIEQQGNTFKATAGTYRFIDK